MYISHFLLIVANISKRRQNRSGKLQLFLVLAQKISSNDILMEESKIDEIQTTFGRRRREKLDKYDIKNPLEMLLCGITGRNMS